MCYNFLCCNNLSSKIQNFSAPSKTKEKDVENGAEPSAPITKKGILTSFKTGKQMAIPDSDIVRKKFLPF